MRERVLSRTCNGRARTGRGSRPHSTRMRASSFNQLVEVEKDACPMLDDERQAVDRNLTRVRCSVFHPGANEQRQFIRGGLLDEAGEEIRVVGRQEILVIAKDATLVFDEPARCARSSRRRKGVSSCRTANLDCSRGSRLVALPTSGTSSSADRIAISSPDQ